MYRVGIDGEANTWTQHERLEDALVRYYALKNLAPSSLIQHVKLMMEIEV